ncbi:MAG: hypothetical protein GXP30_10000, partial [Verrucomicrobia bacterium]|nr:hypothetical protein [Verrucomicrobiota bacterium]
DKITETSLKLDREIFGADRKNLLKSLEQGGMGCRIKKDGSFGLMRPGMNATYLGAISPVDADSGASIARELIDCAPTGPVFWDLPDLNEQATRLAGDLTFEAKRDLLRMYLGDNNTAGNPLRMFGISEPGLG